MSVAHPAATVILLRDGSHGCEALLLRRSSSLSFHGGAWVFPGGRIDPEDYAVAGVDDVTAAARQAAVREAREEAGVEIDPGRLVLMSRWVTPEGAPKRFDTWFFVGPAGEEQVRVDGGEIHAHRWFAPAEALAAHRSGEIDLPPPTFITLLELSKFDRAASAIEFVATEPVRTFLPRVGFMADGTACTLYSEDAAYESGDLDAPGPRHRLVLAPQGWRYLRELG